MYGSAMRLQVWAAFRRAHTNRAKSALIGCAYLYRCVLSCSFMQNLLIFIICIKYLQTHITSIYERILLRYSLNYILYCTVYICIVYIRVQKININLCFPICVWNCEYIFTLIMPYYFSDKIARLNFHAVQIAWKTLALYEDKSSFVRIYFKW